jgi:UDP-N-acetyl-D-glucosamine dehydrogenase
MSSVIDVTGKDLDQGYDTPLPGTAQELLRRIETREAVVAVIGLGYVGLPLAVGYAEAGFRVIGIDVDHRRVETLRNGASPVEDIPSSRLAPLITPFAEAFGPEAVRAGGSISATSDYDALAMVDAVIICVPTPLSHTKDPDMSFIMAATDQIANRLRPGMLVVLESTTYPGTTEEAVLPHLEDPGLIQRRRRGDDRPTDRPSYVVGRDFFLAFSPERIDPGRKDYTVQTTPKVIGGITPVCLQVAAALYQTAINTVVPVSSPKVAEMVKLLENTFRSVNIALVNELALWCDRLGVDVWEVIDAAATKPFGFMAFRPGPGLGGHCIPIDPHYLAWKLRTLDHQARFINLAADINMSMPQHVVGKIADALNDDRKSVKGAKILVLGVAYKPNVSDIRESPALELLHLLGERGANVVYHDPFVPELRMHGRVLRSIDLDETVLQEADCVVIETDHACFSWDEIVTHSRLIVDTRNAATRALATPRARVVKL